MSAIGDDEQRRRHAVTPCRPPGCGDRLDFYHGLLGSDG